MPPNGNAGDEWPKWANYVLETVKEIKVEIKGLRRDIATLELRLGTFAPRSELQAVRDDLLTLKTKAAAYGAVVAFVVSFVAGLIQWLIKGG